MWGIESALQIILDDFPQQTIRGFIYPFFK